MTVDPTKTAFLLLHWQNDLAMRGGKMAGNFPEILSSTRTIERVQKALKASREKGMMVIYINLAYRPGYPELPAKPAPFLADVAKNAALIRETWGSEVIDPLKPLQNDIVISSSSPNGFSYTELDMILRYNGITDLVVTGLGTNWGVESTAREAAGKGYFSYILEDCCVAMSDDLHNWWIKYGLPATGKISNSAQYVACLERANPVPKRTFVPPPADLSTLDTARTALILLHMENDVVTTGGKMAGQFPERLAAAGNLDRIETVLKASREKGIPVIYVVAGMRPGYPDMPGALSPLAGLVVKMGAMVRGTWGAEINEKVKPLKGEVLIYNFGPSGFWHTDLDLILRSKGIKNVVLTGVATNFVVESTARDAAMLGYYFYVLKDCTNSLRDDLHNFSLTNILPMLGAVTDSKTFIEALGKAR